MTSFLAQDTTAATGQFLYAVDQFMTPAGITAGVIFLIITIAAFRTGRAFSLFAAAALFCSTFQLHPDALTKNILLGPIQTFRYLAKSIGFVMLFFAVVALFSVPRGWRAKTAGAAAVAFLCFQLYYDAQLTLFASEGTLKGVFGLASMAFMFAVFGVGYGRLIDNADGAFRAIAVFSLVGTGFVVTNVLQILAGLDGALVAGRLAGIGGNAQMMGAISVMLLLVNAYLFMTAPKLGLLRWLSLVCVGVLPVFVLWTGSRTAVIAMVAGLALMFRLQLGRLAVLLVSAAAISLAASLLLGSENVVSGRFNAAGDTRAAGWTNALYVFSLSPVFGEFPFLQPGDEPNGIESTWLRALANMGVIGGLAVAVPFIIMVANCVRALRLGAVSVEYRKLSDFYLGSVAAILIFNTLDGYAFGYLTFPVMFMYLTFMLGGFLAEAAGEPSFDRADAGEAQVAGI